MYLVRFNYILQILMFSGAFYNIRCEPTHATLTLPFQPSHKNYDGHFLDECYRFRDDSFQYTKTLTLQGRYTRNIVDYQLVIPRKLNAEGKFVTYQIPHYFDQDFKRARKKRSESDKLVHYLVTFDGAHHYVDLWPNHSILSGDMIFENRRPNEKVQSRQLRKQNGNLCYYHGRVRDKPGSRVAVSACDGLVGYIYVNGRRYFIEPAAEHEPNNRGQHLHLVYNGENTNRERKQTESRCGTVGRWEDAWRQRFFEEFSNPSFNVSKRDLVSVPRYLETMVVADKKFLEHHKNTDYDTYVLTIMNMVADFYHDSSAGHQLHVVVVRVMYLEKEEEEIDLTINPDADKSLASFCKWQERVNPKDIQHPNHHDIAVLLTRYDICADNMKNCGLMGLAYVAAACSGDRPCAINEDSGLLLGIVVAHEMGHVMGCAHDKEDESGCKPQAADDSYHVMSPYVHLHTNIWSSCSRGYMTELFDNNLGECLNDEPQESLYKDTNMLPGAVYDAAYQCNIAYPGSSVCKSDPDKFCKMLLCKTNPTTCTSNGEPPADGTKCGENKWCYDLKCVGIGSRPEAVNGGWGDWASFTECSKSCGAGVSYSERECNNPAPKHKGNYCTGERKKIKICNTQPCPEGAKSFRAAQCAEYDKKPFHDGKMYKWSPFFKEAEPCGLFCLNDANVFAKLAPRVKDGTKCKPGAKDMCISGVCRKVGCDYAVDSEATEDQCGVCKGDGTQCKIIEEFYNDPPGAGYVKVATIPKGSKNVEIREEKPSDNTIAISGVDEKNFVLNGNFVEQPDGTREIGGTEGVYSHPEPNKENLVIYGPLKEDIVLFVVYFKNENVGYRYKYAEPSAQTYQPRYHWEFVEWEDCTVRCGGGTELAEADCLEEKAGKVSPSFCQGLEKPPPMTRKCNEQPCKTKWRVGKWSKCSACKFKSGIKMREVECVREAQKAGREDVLIDDDLCPSPKPGTRELCNSHAKCSKTKRNIDGFPTDAMQHLWFQTMDGYMFQKPLSHKDVVLNSERVREARRNIIKSRQSYDSNSRCGNGKGDAKPPLKPGTIVDDKIPSEDIKLIAVPLKQSHLSVNLTDAAFETMGDKISDTVDTCKEKVYTGKEAADLLKQLQHKNTTDDSDKKRSSLDNCANK